MTFTLLLSSGRAPYPSRRTNVQVSYAEMNNSDTRSKRGSPSSAYFASK